jgi:hypothetical protein
MYAILNSIPIFVQCLHVGQHTMMAELLDSVLKKFKDFNFVRDWLQEQFN